MTEDNEDELAEICQRRAAASPSPWTWDSDGHLCAKDGNFVIGPWWDALNSPDAEFIAHAPTDIDWLISEVSHRRTDLAMALTQLKDAIGEIDLLRRQAGLLKSHLREIEFAATNAFGEESCPVCNATENIDAHDHGCWLWKELRP